MGNVLEKTKQEQVIALGRLGWSLRRIEAATGVRRETAGGYLRSAGIAIRTPGGWGRKAPAKPANEVITGFFPSRSAENAKPANDVITGFLPEVGPPEQRGKRSPGASEAYRELIELELSRGRNAMGKAYVAVTDGEHRPAAHRAHLDWPPSRLVQWAAKVGTRTQEVVEKILQAQPHPERGYRSCLGIIRLGQRYPPARVEAAADRALLTGAVSYRSMDSILRRNLDQQPLNPPPATRSRPEHDNIRGAAYFE
jgi:hypothetical protein